MKKLGFFALSMVLFGSFQAQAAIGGSWIGWADWYFDGSGTRCPISKLEFLENDKKLVRVSGSVDCDIVFMESPEMTMEKKNGELWSDGQKIGTYSENNYAWTEIYSETVRIDVTAKREAGHMDYVEHWIGSGERLIYDIRSRLFTSGR